jgi:hypothetical protein
MKRHTRRDGWNWRRIGRTRLVLIAIIVAAAVGFVHFSAVAAFNARYFPAEYAHPWDYIADGCLAVALGAIGVILCGDTELPRRLRKLASGRRWRAAMKARRRA